jgi:hypothetical protein
MTGHNGRLDNTFYPRTFILTILPQPTLHDCIRVRRPTSADRGRPIKLASESTRQMPEAVRSSG